jgi:hypothetical protein
MYVHEKRIHKISTVLQNLSKEILLFQEFSFKRLRFSKKGNILIFQNFFYFQKEKNSIISNSLFEVNIFQRKILLLLNPFLFRKENHVKGFKGFINYCQRHKYLTQT